jgi:hypothetical protein
MSRGLISASICSSSASFGCRGKAAGLVLQVLRAQQRKFRVRSFIFRLIDFFLSAFLVPSLVPGIEVAVVLCVGLFMTATFADGSLLLPPETLRANQKR